MPTLYYADEPLFRALAGVLCRRRRIVICRPKKVPAAWNLAKEARVEVRKVVWPTTQETTQTTLIVVGVVILVGVDSLGAGLKLEFRCSGRNWLGVGERLSQ